MEYKNLSTTLVDLRKSKGLTQVELGKKLGVTNKTISKWENGVFLPDITYLVVIADFYGITVDELLRGTCFETKIFKNEIKQKKPLPFIYRYQDILQPGYFVLFDVILIILNFDSVKDDKILLIINTILISIFTILQIIISIIKIKKKRKDNID